jgi:hypothetical protein
MTIECKSRSLEVVDKHVRRCLVILMTARIPSARLAAVPCSCLGRCVSRRWDPSPNSLAPKKFPARSASSNAKHWHQDLIYSPVNCQLSRHAFTIDPTIRKEPAATGIVDSCTARHFHDDQPFAEPQRHRTRANNSLWLRNGI